MYLYNMAIFKIPSLDYLFEEVRRIAVRFPLSFLASICLALTSFIFIYGDPKEATVFLLGKISMILALAIPLFIALSLWLERQRYLPPQQIALQGGFVALLILYYFTLPASDRISMVDGARYAVLNIVVHLLVAFLPFLGKKEENGFWTFNFLLFSRVIVVVVYSLVLLIGIFSALGAIYLLFKVEISWKVYATVGTLICILLNTFMFLSGIPKDLGELEKSEYYPNGLKIFTQYILVPLITVYGAILYAYGLMILFSWSLPKGMIIGLMIGFCVSSMFALLLIHPVRERAGNQWISLFSKGFYIGILPLLLLYFIAIGKRLLQYGLTEDRYFVVLAGLWLTSMAVYFIIAKTKRLMVIPASLSVIMLLSVVGPWSAFTVSAYNQVVIFGDILTKNKALDAQGKIDPKNESIKKMPKQDKNRIKDIVQFLAYRNSAYYLQPYFKEDLSKGRKKTWVEGDRILALMGDEMAKTAYESSKNETKSFYIQRQNWQKVEGYQYNIDVNVYGNDYNVPPPNIELDKGTLKLNLNRDNSKLDISFNGKDLTTINLKTTIQNLWEKDTNNPADADMSIQTEGGKFKILLKIEQMNVTKDDNGKDYSTTSLRGNLLLRFIE